MEPGRRAQRESPVRDSGISPRAEKTGSVLLYLVAGPMLTVAWAPFLLWIDCAVAAIRAWAFLGYWPSYGHPDPKTLPESFGPLPMWLESVVPPLGLLTLVALSLLVMRRAVPKRWWLWLAMILWPVVWAAFVALVRADPGGVLDWYFD
jgi:hypothetical protein